ncbi:hypothetical protein IE4771_PB00108 (plasmid) [Rhizobium etli bv. mimosae str. IE4771]|uniref:Uncharacterized protein n=1 Tax=Rhizobium etli bv. mimosae str. IE4771 TaxID=1432050 RepID=A0A060I7V9_RHIET|nr:hypothetical protein IE4771_PB00108 [Rhizobium sp. IE4771]
MLQVYSAWISIAGRVEIIRVLDDDEMRKGFILLAVDALRPSATLRAAARSTT